MDIILFQAILASSIFIFVLPKKWKHGYTALVMTALAAVTTYWAVNVLLSGDTIYRTFVFEFWDQFPMLEIDVLSALFIIVINIAGITGIIYAGGYLKSYHETKSGTAFSIHYFAFFWLQASMLQVTTLQAGLEFLLVWELMALSSFFLVIFEGEKEGVLETGINYLIQMHIGFGFILAAFLIVQHETGEMGFHALTNYFSTHSNIALFILFFIGFGVKAGFIPFHTWLPRAHPAAPTHVSAFMSSVIIKMGIYGILRVITHVQTDFYEIGLLILGVSIVSGIMGVILAIFQHDLKKLLAYHSIENIGIIGIGIGVGVLGQNFHNHVLTMLGFGGAILHVFNHSLFKSALFYAAGNVYKSTHTRNIESLGGLIKNMPWTAMIFLVSALAICGIPPFNGFISEFLIYSGVFQNLTHADFTNSFISVASIVSLALIGGLALFCFTKAFGITFLGTRRSLGALEIKERPWSMLVPGFIPIAIMVLIGFAPLPFFETIQSSFVNFPYIDFHGGEDEPIQFALSQIATINLIFVAIVLLLMFIRNRQQKKVTVEYGPTWGCGYTAGDYNHQYTSTSFADNLKDLIKPLILYHRHHEGIEEDEIFPVEKTFQTHVDDKIEVKWLLAPIHWFKDLLPKAGLAQTGNIQHYVMYPVAFMLIIGILTFLHLL